MSDGLARKWAWQIESDIEIPIPSNSEYSYLDKLKAGLDKLPSFGLPELTLLLMEVIHSSWIRSKAQTLNLSLEQLLQRDQMIHEFLNTLKIPQLWLMSGGYRHDSWKPYANFLEKIIK